MSQVLPALWQETCLLPQLQFLRTRPQTCIQLTKCTVQGPDAGGCAVKTYNVCSWEATYTCMQYTPETIDIPQMGSSSFSDNSLKQDTRKEKWQFPPACLLSGASCAYTTGRWEVWLQEACLKNKLSGTTLLMMIRRTNKILDVSICTLMVSNNSHHIILIKGIIRACCNVLSLGYRLEQNTPLRPCAQTIAHSLHVQGLLFNLKLKGFRQYN